MISPLILYHPPPLKDVFEGLLYWTDWQTSEIHFCDRRGSDCGSVHEEEDEIPMGVSIYHPARERKDLFNPCEEADCSHVCVLSKEGYSWWGRKIIYEEIHPPVIAYDFYFRLRSLCPDSDNLGQGEVCAERRASVAPPPPSSSTTEGYPFPEGEVDDGFPLATVLLVLVLVVLVALALAAVFFIQRRKETVGGGRGQQQRQQEQLSFEPVHFRATAAASTEGGNNCAAEAEATEAPDGQLPRGGDGGDAEEGGEGGEGGGNYYYYCESADVSSLISNEAPPAGRSGDGSPSAGLYQNEDVLRV